MKLKDTELFIQCCKDNNLEKVQACLTLEVDVNSVDDWGDTAAHSAAELGHTEVIRVLAGTGLVDWNKGGKSGWTPLHVALFWGQSDVAGIIAKQATVNFSLETLFGTTVAMAAVRGGNARCVEILAEKENCDNWNIPDDDGDTPLMQALMDGKKDILKILLDCPQLNPNLKDWDGYSPLMKAIKAEKTAMARMLIKCSRVDLGTRDRNGASLQRIAREGGLSEICDLIEEAKDARSDAKIRQLAEEKAELSRSLLEKIPECPVCLERFQKDRPIFICIFGHHICGSCKANKIKAIKVCPTCQRPFSGRAHDFEKFVSDIWG